jgi:hypothetical protein
MNKTQEAEKYNQGYIPKVQYWTDKLMNALTPIDQIKSLNKVRYFQKRHHKAYGIWPEMVVKSDDERNDGGAAFIYNEAKQIEEVIFTAR